jgi:hypothetical protein
MFGAGQVVDEPAGAGPGADSAAGSSGGGEEGDRADLSSRSTDVQART